MGLELPHALDNGGAGVTLRDRHDVCVQVLPSEGIGTKMLTSTGVRVSFESADEPARTP